ncbi:beta-defensin 13-like [Erythrolamprus reginae]|uniref:beta-defensin 13-like n=1 Tax=Erythrolamprus reginae TaxID=121349 RepID=UPI00396CCF89
MRTIFMLWALFLFLCQAVPAKGDLYDSLVCRNNHGRCRRICFHHEQVIGTCTNGRQRCCKGTT